MHAAPSLGGCSQGFTAAQATTKLLDLSSPAEPLIFLLHLQQQEELKPHLPHPRSVLSHCIIIPPLKGA